MAQCSDIRQRLLAGETLTTEEQAHLGRCEGCNSTKRDAVLLDDKLSEAIRIPIDSAELQQKLLQIPWKQGKPRFYQQPVKVAASVFLIIGLSGLLYRQALLSQPWETIVYDHILHEPEALFLDEAVSQKVVNNMAGQFGLALADSLGQVNYISLCPIAGQTSLHLVVKGKKGPVTVFYVPGHHPDAPLTLDKGRFHGVIETNRGGTLAIIGEGDEPMDEIRERVEQSLIWL